MLRRIDAVLDGGACWGAELDARYRVLAVTFDPVPGTHPDGPVDDTRLLLVLHPVTEIEARLVRERDDGRAVVERFNAEQLVPVVDRLGGATLVAPVLDPDAGPLPAPLSFEGRSEAPDGRLHDAVLVLSRSDRTLTLRATFDIAEVRRPDGSTLLGPLPVI